MDIFVLGFYGKLNCGDESYKNTFTTLFHEHNLTFKDTLSESDIEKYDVIILGGGNVIRKGFLQQLEKVKGRKKIYGFSVGIEEYPTENLDFFEHVYARDTRTLEFLEKNNISCSLIPDAALILKGDPERGKAWITKKFEDEGCDLYSNVIAIVINSYLLNGSLGGLARDAIAFLKFSYDMARIIDETPASFIFLPFCSKPPFDDRTSNAWIASKCKYWKKNCVVFDKIDHQEALDIIAAADLTISSRLHSSIFSFATGTPFLDITHHSKNKLFLEMIGKEKNSFSFWEFHAEEMKNQIQLMMSKIKHDECDPYRTLIEKEVNAIRFN